MAATLKLEGRILTLTDGDTTSSVDLSAVKGDIGVRGVQGIAGTANIKSAEEVSY